MRSNASWIVWCVNVIWTSVSETIGKPPLVKSQTALRKQKIKKIKYGEKTISNMAHRILTPCNVARLWHWFRQVTSSCNVACCSGIMTVNSLSGSRPTLQLNTWLWMTCHWIHQVAAPCNVAGGSGMTCYWIRPNVRHIGILLLVSISAV